jgi:Histidine phosphatase superfamily (branch 1)
MNSNGVTVLLLRHGERADETDDALSRPLPSCVKARMDPDLTDEGHRQATDAFQQIVPFLKGKRVAFFVSPLRRTIATAAMIGRCNTDGVEFVLPSGDPSSIPLVVMNGLSDCAAHVVKEGGAFAAVKAGYIDGAAMAANNGSSNSPLMKVMDTLQPQRWELQKPIQLYKEHKDEFVPMTAPIGCSEPPLIELDVVGANDDGAVTLEDNQQSVDTTPVARYASDDAFFKTMTRIVKMAASRSCNVCVVVSHREGIRDLARDILRSQNRISTPYCCIGHFSAHLLEDTDASHVQWKFHNVIPYEKFGEEVDMGTLDLGQPTL